ncbi:MAG TPA: phosphoglycerate dehydrogenase [Pirellulaceae bacterium]|nr:phosphoglycerate dehydrogenase [Pirellulaceae bacterium]
MPQIVVLDDLSPEGLELLRREAGIGFEVRVGLKGEALRETLAQFDGAICRSGVKITSEVLAGNERLRAIVRAGVGTDNIDKEAATRQGIIVMNTPAGNTISTAEHTLAMMLSLARNVAPAHAKLMAGVWDRKSFQGTELKGKTLGVIGLGRIGQAVASRARAFEMQVIGYDPFLSRDKAAQLGLDVRHSLDELFPEVDFLTVHTPLTAETQNLINSQTLTKLKPGVRLINCARGGIFDETALVEGLTSGTIAGIALDVFAHEPCTESPLFGLPGVLCTPHLGASTDEAQRQVALEAVELLLRFLTKGEIRHAVNAAPVDVQTLNRLKGYLKVAHRLGALLAQWHGGAISSCHVGLEGEIAGEDSRLITSAFCAGLLSNVTHQANWINAEAICQERGIEINRQSNPEHGTFSSVIACRVSGAGIDRSAAGTVFGKHMPRLIRLERFQLEAFLDGHLLIFSHQDVPGIIGFVGGILAEYQVNIAQMAVGRLSRAPGGTSIGVLNLDSPAPSEALSRIEQHPQIREARQVCAIPTEQEQIWFA